MPNTSVVHPVTLQRGGVLKTILIILALVIAFVLVVSYLKKNNFFNINKTSITKPIQKINPFSLRKPDDRFSGYGVQVIATTDITEGRRVMNKFAQDGYSAFIVQVKRRGRALYLVRLGPYTRSEAIAVNDKIKRRYRRSPYVRDSFVARRDS